MSDEQPKACQRCGGADLKTHVVYYQPNPSAVAMGAYVGPTAPHYERWCQPCIDGWKAARRYAELGRVG